MIIFIVMLDVIWSTLSTDGAGPIAEEVTSVLWRFFRAIHRRRPSHQLLKITSVVILLTIFITWIILLWTGWLLVFISYDAAVLFSSPREPALLLDRVYFVGMTLFTLGTGDFVTGNSGWRILMALASANGLVMTTLVITYLLPVLSAAIDRRQLALAIWGMGASADEIVTNGWNGENFDQLENQLNSIAMMLTLHAERHLAYPVLQYFHATDPRADLSPRIATLDNATTLLRNCVTPKARPTETVLRILRKSLNSYTLGLQEYHIKPEEEPPPLPDIDALRNADIPLCDDEDIKACFENIHERRELLCGLLRGDAWEWGD